MTNGATLLFRTLVVVFILSTTACASLRPMVTSSDEWIAYRKTRVSQTFEGRIIAAARYLAQYPNGAFAPETREYFRVAESLYFDNLRKTHDGFYTYLAALPRGPHADEARQLLYREASRPRGPTGFDGEIMAMDARIAAVAARRASAREEMLNVLRLWLDADAFARPISEAKATIVVPWSLSLPKARCRREEPEKGDFFRICTKLYELPYDARNGEELEEREATMDVSVHQDLNGRPYKVTLGGPDLFVRLEEMFGGRTIATADPRGRAAGVSRATEVVRREFGDRISDDATCRKRPPEGAVLALECNGLRVIVEAALEVSTDDRIVIEPVAAP
jgi:hypothetical protein